MLNEKDFYASKNDETRTVYVGGGFSLPTVLTLIFVVLRLMNVITWSWMWVLSPLWISMALIILILLISLIVVSIASLIVYIKQKKL